MRNFILFLAFSGAAFGQCGVFAYNPVTRQLDCTGPAGAGSGSVTSVGLAGTANQITVTGASPITASGSWTLSLPTAGVTLPGTTTIGILSAKQNVMDAVSFCSDAGSTDDYACDLTPAISAYVTGTHYRFLANTANTGAATVALNSLAAKTIVKVQGGITTALATNDIRVGQWVDIVYDGTNMQMQSTLGNAGGAGTPGGSDTQCQYNNSGAFGGISGCTTNGTAVTLVAPALGTPTALVLTNATGLPAAAVLAGTFGTGSYTISSNLTVSGHTIFEGVTSTGATGTGKLVYDGTPTLVTPNIGAATGTSLTVTGAVTSGSGSGVGGAFDLLQGTLPSIVANTISHVAPTSVTGYEIVGAGAAGTGLPHWSNAANVVTESVGLIVNADITNSTIDLTAKVTGVLPTANIAVALANQTSLRGNAMAAAAGDATIGQVIAHGAKALATSAISSAACSSAQTDTATGTLTTDAIAASFNADPTAVTGYVPLTAGMLTIIAYPTADTVNFKVCNNTSSSITPGAITLNWRVIR